MIKYNLKTDKMSKLLIPIDFSEYSENAIRYACQIATANGQSIDLVHVFSWHSNSYLNNQEEATLNDPRVPEAEEQMERTINWLSQEFPGISTQALFRNGNLYEEIKSLTNQTPYDAVVMGTDGASGLEALFIGSNTYDTILNTTTPVLAVPKSSQKFDKKHVGLLCNFKEAELSALEQARPLLNDAYHLILIHVNLNDRAINELDNEFKRWIERIETEIGLSDISYVIKPQTLFAHQKESLPDAITAALIDEHVDFLVITKSRKNIFRKLIQPNVVKKLAFSMRIPTFFARVLIKK